MQKLIKSILKHKYLVLAVSYTLWLTVVSLAPLDGIYLPSFHFMDKFVHVFLYFFLILFWIKVKVLKLKFNYFILSFVIILWGIIIEFIQENFIPTRSGDIYDVFANILGTVIGILFHNRYNLFK